ncbi:MAG: hypothetical protein IIY57_02740 [Erysipelotrichaceae bacterium]|nr:hypothetical protein [Erysipelotrichaceae bacterium]
MKKIIVVMLCRMMVLSAGCSSQQEDPVIEDVDYNKYLAYKCELPEPLYYPNREDFTKDGVLNHESWSIALAEFTTRNQDIEANITFNRTLAPFYQTMVKTLLKDGRENRVFSPVNLYFNLTALAAITQKDAKREIMELLGTDEENALTDYQRQWKDNQFTGKTVFNYASSIWFSDQLKLKKQNLKDFSNDYYTPVFTGTTGTDEYTGAFQSWLNDNTGKMLTDYISALKLDEKVRMALASTIYYKGSWMTGYLPENTRKEVFHSPEGDVNTDMMHKSVSMICLDNPYFTGVFDFVGSGSEIALFLLPKEGVSFREMYDSEEFRRIVFDNQVNDDEVKAQMVDLTLPKFDISASFALEEILPSLGIKGIFGAQSDAFGTISDEPLAVSAIEHACRVRADENGIEAAAYTVEEMAMAEPLQEHVKLTFDRPFFFALKSGYDNTVLFTGVIANT